MLGNTRYGFSILHPPHFCTYAFSFPWYCHLWTAEKCQAKQFTSGLFLPSYFSCIFSFAGKTYCSILCSHIFGRVFKQATYWMLKCWTGFKKLHFCLSCGLNVFICICFDSSPNSKCNGLSMWKLCWVGGLVVCSTHPVLSSNLVCIHPMVSRPKDKKNPDRQFINSCSSILWSYCIPSSTG